ncbi:phosphohistidine phosphatase [Campylobacter insulaenigrae]|uniref:Phosphohistidine phosphatase n=5 Tax=Campylobacter insulaenigrae TaxID=260714 RepID=A0A0A8H1X9_9BACT|nr:phosphohistidine phosphatase [Campylobacter insulaenigrae]AJC87680.1 phosphohistidine phosphatase [Campylobacter insulaenigrae NCTC 12927]MCR6570123.1 phosphohistidine phosphatase [Campylobacter insulaenigrae]MCR6571908.1 phosphohistidine phosphatase [Campylobacter insulaenigrae]MCR6573166.1 phosphohistidine phosphatase [Campylobacter insulaenigrae]MCR6574953.1 phosphohistidine phosphatase [Campylobacter insulaenigrae]
MKFIYFIRNAKAQKDSEIEDLQRDLSSSGKEDLKIMSNRLQKLNFKAEYMFSSPAKRCIKTAQKLCKYFDIKEKDIWIEKSLYEGKMEEILNYISKIKENRVVFVMHKSMIIKICEYLACIDLENFPTSSIICLKFNIDSFEHIKEQSGELIFFDFPKSQNE